MYLTSTGIILLSALAVTFFGLSLYFWCTRNQASRPSHDSIELVEPRQVEPSEAYDDVEYASAETYKQPAVCPRQSQSSVTYDEILLGSGSPEGCLQPATRNTLTVMMASTTARLNSLNARVNELATVVRSLELHSQGASRSADNDLYQNEPGERDDVAMWIEDGIEIIDYSK